MAFPNVIAGPEGEQFHRYTTQRWPLGTMMRLNDGRIFRFAGTGAATGGIAGGRVVQARAATTVFELFTVNGNGAPVQFATTVTIVSAVANSTFSANQFAEGYLAVMTSTASTPGLYKIKSHAAQPTTGVATEFTLAGGSGLQEALTTGTTLALFPSPYSKLVLSSTGASPGARVMGVTVTSLSSAAFGWIQTAGPAPVLIDGSVVVGTGLYPSTAIAGAAASPTSVGISTASFNPSLFTPLGTVMAPGVDTKFGIVYLNLES